MGKWDKIKLGDICQISKGIQLNKIELEKAGDYPCINGGIQPSGYTHKWNTEANTITISEGGNSCGYVNFLTTRFWSGGHCYSLLDLKKNIDANFLYQALKGRESLIMGLRVGSGLPNIQQKAIREFEFDCPKEKPEQTLIAQILSKVDGGIELTEKLIAKYQRTKTGLMQDLLTKGIDEQGNIRSEKTHRFKTENGLSVPEEWNILRLKNCVTKGTTITYGIVQTGLHRPDGVRVLRTVDLKEDYIDSSNLLRTSPEISNLFKRTILKEGDLVCNVRASVGDFNIVPKELEGVNTTRGVARISPKQEINNRYLLWFLKSETNKRQMELLIKGTTFIDINIADLREIFVCIPKKIEQDKIANNLESILKTINDAKANLHKLQSLKTGLMQDLLSGKVRVKIKENELA
jgi:type I restriction enzyme S subunit